MVIFGESAIRERLPCLVSDCLASEGTSWPHIPGLAEVTAGPSITDPGIGSNPGSEERGACRPEDAACEAPTPI